MLAGSLTMHVAYGEARVFDLRLADSEQLADVLFGVLIDTSASMQTAGRLGRAKAHGPFL